MKSKQTIMRPKEMDISVNYVNKLLGMNFTISEIKEHLRRMRYGTQDLVGKKDCVRVFIPAYRADVIHPIDLVEDIAISYGYDKFEPVLPKIATSGNISLFENFLRKVRDIGIGFSFTEIMTLVLTNPRDSFERMNLPIPKSDKFVEAEKPVSLDHSIARTWVLPSLMAFLEKNKNREYPQRIFEIGDTITGEGKNVKCFAGVIIHEKVSFSEMKSIIAGIFESFGLNFEVKEFWHGSFIPGRVARIKENDIGFFGEIHPQVLENFSLETPGVAFELNVSKIFENKK